MTAATAGCASSVIPTDAVRVAEYFNKAADAAAESPDKNCLSRRITPAFHTLTAGTASLLNAAVGYPLQGVANLAKNLSSLEFTQAVKDLFTDLLGIAKSLILAIAAVFNAVIGFVCPSIHNNMRTDPKPEAPASGPQAPIAPQSEDVASLTARLNDAERALQAARQDHKAAADDIRTRLQPQLEAAQGDLFAKTRRAEELARLLDAKTGDVAHFREVLKEREATLLTETKKADKLARLLDAKTAEHNRFKEQTQTDGFDGATREQNIRLMQEVEHLRRDMSEQDEANRRQAESYQSSLGELRSQLAEQEEKVRVSGSEVSEAREQSAADQERMKALTLELEQANEQLRETARESADHEAKYQQAQSDLSALQQVLTAKEEGHNAVVSQLEATQQAELDEAIRKSEALKAELQTAKAAESAARAAQENLEQQAASRQESDRQLTGLLTALGVNTVETTDPKTQLQIASLATQTLQDQARRLREMEAAQEGSSLWNTSNDETARSPSAEGEGGDDAELVRQLITPTLAALAENGDEVAASAPKSPSRAQVSDAEVVSFVVEAEAADQTPRTPPTVASLISDAAQKHGVPLTPSTTGMDATEANALRALLQELMDKEVEGIEEDVRRAGLTLTSTNSLSKDNAQKLMRILTSRTDTLAAAAEARTPPTVASLISDAAQRHGVPLTPSTTGMDGTEANKLRGVLRDLIAQNVKGIEREVRVAGIDLNKTKGMSGTEAQALKQILISRMDSLAEAQ